MKKIVQIFSKIQYSVKRFIVIQIIKHFIYYSVQRLKSIVQLWFKNVNLSFLLGLASYLRIMNRVKRLWLLSLVTDKIYFVDS